MNIGEAAERSSLPAKTIRYYEQIGLVIPARRPNGYRDYQPDDVSRLRFLQRSRALGFSIEQCRELLSLQADEHRASGEVKALTQAHLKQIDRKLAELQCLRATLITLAGACRGDDRPECAILDELTNRGARAARKRA